jgi:hypothetical protein
VEGFRAEIRVENRRKASLHLRATKQSKTKKLNSELIPTTNCQIFKKNKLLLYRTSYHPVQLYCKCYDC